MKFSRELGVPAIPPAEDKANTTYARRAKVKTKHQGRQQLRSKWESKTLHGKYPQQVKQADVDQDKTHRWPKEAGLKAETEGLIIAPQDQSLPTRWHQHNILKKADVDPKCRLWGRFDETIDHLISGCPELVKTEYFHRHNKAAAHMHWKICREFGIEVKERWYEHEPKAVTGNSVTILWDILIHTDRTIPVHCAKEQGGQNLPSHWHDYTPRHPVVMGAFGTIKKDMENYTNKIPGNINIHELQKITLLSTAHLLRQVLSIK